MISCLVLVLLLSTGRSSAETCSAQFACLDVGDNLIDAVHDVTEEVDCMRRCGEVSSCTFYTWYDVSTTMANMCLMFSSCDVTDETCSGCFSGPPNCDTVTTTTASSGIGLLFLGPGYGSYGKSEIISLPDLSYSNCSVPPHPAGHVYATVGNIMDDGSALICGGYNYDTLTTLSTCYILNTEWSPEESMILRRAGAAASNVEGGWWVTGGALDGDEGIIASTELFSNGEWVANEDLPEGVYGHCMVQLNNTHVFYSGGYTGSVATAATYIFSERGGFSRQKDMAVGRYNHGCVVRNSEVWVAGGYTDSVEIFSLSSWTWQVGPTLPFSAIGGELVAYDGELMFIGGYGDNQNRIFQLEKDALVWQNVGMMETVRVKFPALEWNSGYC